MSGAVADTVETTPTSLDGDAVQRRVNQIYRSYLLAVFKVDAYKCIYGRKIAKARKFDFVIGLAAALGGGSGLGILADERLAWACGLITGLSVILTVAKGVWNWPEELKSVSSSIQNYSTIATRYLDLIDEINYRRAFSEAQDATFRDIKKAQNDIAEDVFDLDESERRTIQDAIKRRIDYKTWWRWA